MNYAKARKAMTQDSAYSTEKNLLNVKRKEKMPHQKKKTKK